MEISRRKLAKSSASLGILASLAACGIIQDANGVVTINLSVAQQQASAFYTAIKAEAPVVTAFSASAGASLVKELPILGNVVSVFATLPASSSFGTIGQDVTSLISIAEVILPIVSPALGSATVEALKASLLIFAAFAGGQSSVTLPASVVAPETGFKSTPVIPGPIPIPLS